MEEPADNISLPLQNKPVDNRPKTLNLKYTLVVVIPSVLFATILTLNYLNIIPLSYLYPQQLGFLPHQNRSLIVSCPVPKEFCQLKKNTTYQRNPAIAFNVPSNTPLLTITKIIDFQRHTIQPYKEENPRALFQTAILGNDCYTITYTVPFDTVVKKIDLLPIPEKSTIATASAKLIDVNQDKANLIIQIQKKPLDKATLGQPDFKRCSVEDLRQNNFGPFQSTDTLKF